MIASHFTSGVGNAAQIATVGDASKISDCSVACQFEQATVTLILQLLYINERSRQLRALLDGDQDNKQQIWEVTQGFCVKSQIDEDASACVKRYHQFWFLQMLKIREAILKNDTVRLQLAKGQPVTWESSNKAHKPILPTLPTLAELELQKVDLTKVPGDDAHLEFYKEASKAKFAPSNYVANMEETAVSEKRKWTQLKRKSDGSIEIDKGLQAKAEVTNQALLRGLRPPPLVKSRSLTSVRDLKNETDLRKDTISANAYNVAREQIVNAFMNPTIYKGAEPAPPPPAASLAKSKGMSDERKSANANARRAFASDDPSAPKDSKKSPDEVQYGTVGSEGSRSASAGNGSQGEYQKPQRQVGANATLTLKELVTQRPELAKNDTKIGIDPKFLNDILMSYASAAEGLP